MKVLNLIIKQNYLDEIIAGKKVLEFREVKPTTYKKYLELDSEGFEVEDEYHNSVPIKYDAIKFFAGYAKNRDWALVEVKDTWVDMLADQEGVITYTYDNLDWVAQQITYSLGKVIEYQKK